jgi:hypothetical protein
MQDGTRQVEGDPGGLQGEVSRLQPLRTPDRRRGRGRERDRSRNAAKACKAKRAEDPDAFAEEYGTNKNRKNAFGKCVSSKAKAKKADMDAKDERRVAALKNAAKECAREREELGEDDFAADHGKRNAFGRCVSDKAREGEGAPDA